MNRKLIHRKLRTYDPSFQFSARAVLRYVPVGECAQARHDPMVLLQALLHCSSA